MPTTTGALQPSADAAEIPTSLASNSMTLPVDTAPVRSSSNIGTLSPVAFVINTDDTGVGTPADPDIAALDKGGKLADQLAELHAQAARDAAENARIDEIVAKGGLDGWIAEALRIMELPQSYAPGVKKIIMAESGGNPRAINNWDANAARGTPSEGLMQTIPSTFRKFVHPSVANRSITDPVANITAGVRYMIATYGVDTLTSGGRSNHLGQYIGY
ncbi:transglycosylase SLT domain-containing protein [Pseudonocardia sp. N23]|uniref:transglycosylase SLT domain-containing protein n=1 Tax=Pseudonocardia sp. N23 TaxID=1987376 RepID=UPI000BFDEA9C|nr:transglycosylase SLT domain-containing protein [Pseudonocardia sp. N23]GAY07095.1 phage tail length tape-measure protein [Pseudonocardia sp. N23]